MESFESREGRGTSEGGVRAMGIGPNRTVIPRPLTPRPISEGKNLKDLGVKELLMRLVKEKEAAERDADTTKKKKLWRWPWGIKSKAGQAAKKTDSILVFYLNIKGELEQPMVLPIYGGNMVIIRNKIYEVDPRAIWTFKSGFKTYKVLIIKEIDRRPVSNLDLDEVRKRGDATDSDEFLIKAALKAQTVQTAKAMNKGIIIAIVIGIIALVIFLLVKG